MADNVVFAFGGKITTMAGVLKANDTFMPIDRKDFITPYGLLIPTSSNCWNLLDEFEGTRPSWVTPTTGFLAILLDADGVFRELFLDKDGITYNRIQSTAKWCRSRALVEDERIIALMALYNTHDEIIDQLCQHAGYKRHWFVTTPIADLVELVRPKENT